MSSYRIDTDRTLRDGQGKAIGKVGYNNEVRDGWRDRGSLTGQERYVDEYGRDRGWAVRSGSTGDSGAGAALGLVILLFWGMFALVSWILDKLQVRKSQRSGSIPPSPLAPSAQAQTTNTVPVFVFEPLDLPFLGGEQGASGIRSQRDAG